MSDVAAVDAADPTPAPTSRWHRVATRLRLRQILTRDLLVLAALSGVAITQPILDLFGRNPELFVAQGVPDSRIVLFALVVTFAVPLLCLAIELVAYAIGERVGRAVHVALVALLSAVLGLRIANELGAGDVLSTVIALAVAGGITVARMRFDWAEQMLRYLSAALLVFLAAFLFFSRTGELLAAGEAEVAEDVRIERPAPIVIVQFDEFPLASLLGADGEINAERFPNFARLADSATWFRNARTVSPETVLSVPAAVSGVVPPGDALPISADHPRTIFTLLGADYEMIVEEPITDLCPTAVCDYDPPAAAPEPRTDIYDDALVVFGHVTLPPSLIDDLPDVDRSWGGYLTSVEEPVIAVEEPPVDPLVDAALDNDDPRPSTPLDKWSGQGPDIWAPRYQSSIVERLVDAVEATDVPTLWYSHAVFPHAPWHLTPEGLEYKRGDDRVTRGVVDGVWHEDEWYVRQGLQRHLLQVGYADTMIGELIDRLISEGMWDEALVVVLSDHGVAFEPGASPRDWQNWYEMYNVPLFVKTPSQPTGETRDDDVLLIDVLPTIVDVLGIDTDWQFEGRSLADPPAEGVGPRAGAPTPEPFELDELLQVVERNEAWLPHGDGWAAIPAVGELGQLVGRSVDTLDVVGDHDLAWTLDQLADVVDWRPDTKRFVPMMWTGSVTTADGAPPPAEMLAVVNGEVAGVVGGFGQAGSAPDGYSAIILADPLEVGFNEVGLLVPTDGGRRFERVGRSS